MNRELHYWGSESDTDSDHSDNENERNKEKKKNVVQSNKSPKVLKELQIGLNRLRNDNKLCDITIKTENIEIIAHKLVLCACSSYFNAMLTGNFTEQKNNEIMINKVNGEIVKLIIDYLYTGKLEYTDNNIEEIITVAKYLQIDSAEDVCVTHLMENINITNCLKLIQFSEAQSLKTLSAQLVIYISENFHKLYIKEEFLLINYNEFKSILDNAIVKNYPEDNIFVLILKWINFDIKTRIENLDNLLDTITASHITKELLNSNKVLKNIGFDKLTKWISKSEEIDVQNASNWDIVVFVRRNHEFTPQLYKLNSEAFSDIKDLPKKICEGSFATNGGVMYYQGGYLSKKPVTNEAFAYNLYKNKWTSFIPMKYPRAYHRSCILNSCLYSIGGSDGRQVFKNVESIDLITGIQNLHADLIERREVMGLTCHSNTLYVMGGRNRGIGVYSSVERMDPRIGKWELLEHCPYLKGITSSATIGDSIYCVNGCNGLDRYDVKMNQWTSIRTQYNRYPVELLEIKNELYGIFKDHIAKYETMIGKWKLTHQLRYHQDYLSAAPLLIANIDSNLDLIRNNENQNESSDSDADDDDANQNIAF